MRRGGEHWNNEQLLLSERPWNNSGSQREAAINKETPWVQRRKIHFQGGGHSNRVLFVTPSEWSFLELEISADYHCRKEMLSSAFWRELTLFEEKTKPSDSLGLFIQLHSFHFWVWGLKSIRCSYSHAYTTFFFILFPSRFLETRKCQAGFFLSLWSSSTSTFQ